MADLTLEEMEKRHIARVPKEERGQMKASAQRLGISRTSLYRKVRAYRASVVQ